jgi:hypothetical protein
MYGACGMSAQTEKLKAEIEKLRFQLRELAVSTGQWRLAYFIIAHDLNAEEVAKIHEVFERFDNNIDIKGVPLNGITDREFELEMATWTPVAMDDVRSLVLSMNEDGRWTKVCDWYLR